MNKQEFIDKLYNDLSGLPQAEIEERVNFYSEMIDDRIEDGLSEQDAVAQIGSVDDIVLQIISETPINKIVKERIKTAKKLKTWEIVLLASGSPIWLSLLIAALAVVITVYVSIWSVIISLWAAFASVIGGGIGCIATAIIHPGASSLAIAGAGLVCIGIGILLFFGCKAATRGTILLTKKVVIGFKNRLIRKVEA